jgi:polysaccharide pyruvyl transferase CsaB
LRLVVSGYYGFGNTGDDAVLAGMLELFARAGVDRADVTVLSGDPARTEGEHAVRGVSRWNPLRVAAELRRADALVSGGGSLLQDVTGAGTVGYYAGVMQLARLARRPYAVVAQGLGPIRRPPNRRIARATLNRAAHLSLRDDRSIALARRIGVTRPIQRAADPAVALRPPRHREEPGTHVLVAVRGGFPADAIVGPLRDVVAELAREHRILALPMHGAVDRDASRALVTGIAAAESTDPDAAFGEKLSAIAGASVVIGVRLHALVLAAAAGVPAVAISYDPKVEAFAERAGIPVIASTTSVLDLESALATIADVVRAGSDQYAGRVEAMRREADAAVREALTALAGGPS